MNKLHRDGDKPAVIAQDGGLEWWIKAAKHRDHKKPAVITTSGKYEWWQNNTWLKWKQVTNFACSSARFMFVIAVLV